MEQYLREQRQSVGVFFNAADFQIPVNSSQCADADASFASPSSTLSSVTSQELSDFITEFRQAHCNLRPRRNNGLLTKEELAEVFFLLDQEPSEEILNDMFNEVDAEGKGFVELESFLQVMERKLTFENMRALTPVSKSCSPPSSAHSAARRVVGPSQEYAAAICAAADSLRISTVSPPHSAQDKRPGSSTALSASSKTRRDSGGVKLNSSNGRKNSNNRTPIILWWGFQDLADML
jgi:hypothetical protein